MSSPALTKPLRLTLASSFLILAGYLVLVAPIYSQTIDLSCVGGSFGNFSSTGTAFTSVVNLILMMSAVVAFLYIFWGAFDYVRAQDSSEAVQKARTKMLNAVIGLMVVALSFAIWTAVLKITQQEGLYQGASTGTNIGTACK